MIRFFCSKNSALLLSALLMVACQPPSDRRSSAIDPSNNTESSTDNPDRPIVIDADTVSLSPDHILTIKSSRYQPSLGLQGVIEPTKQSRFTALKAVEVKQVLVKQGQWVEKGTLLLTLQRIDNPTVSSATTDSQTSNNQIDTKETVSSDAQANSDIATTTTKNIKSLPLNEIPKTVEPSVKPQPTDTDAKPTIKNNNKNVDQTNVQTTEAGSQPVDNAKAVVTKTPVLNKGSLIAVRASFSGRITALPAQVGQQLRSRMPLITIGDDTDLRFIATLPIQAEPKLSIGQTVNFTAKGNLAKYTGQVSRLVRDDKLNQLLVYVHVLKNDVTKDSLKLNTAVTGRIDYGQIAVGTVVPKNAIHDANLDELKLPPYQPLAPLAANVWIVKQDQRLTRQPIEVIKYDPTTKQYLIAGINNDSLICLADLPIESAGKKVVIS